MTPHEDVVQLLRALVRIPSVSGEEDECRDVLAQWMVTRGIQTELHGRNVIGVVEGTAVGGERPDRGLLYCTHIDVVPVGPGWTRDPWDGALINGRIHGRGSNDAKSSVAAMAVAAAHIDRSQLYGRIVLAFVCDEETGGDGIEACRDTLPPCDAAIVGEPSELDVCPGQRGLLRASIKVQGRSCHASRPHEGVNALVGAARDVLALDALDLGESHPLLGRATLQPTVLHAGTRPNVLPGEAVIDLDGRPTPACDNERMLQLIDAATEGELIVKSKRLTPVVTPEDAEIVRIAQAASPTGKVRGFGGLSDRVHLADIPGLVMGPGTSVQSHAPDESVAVDQVTQAVDAYTKITNAYLGAVAPDLVLNPTPNP